MSEFLCMALLTIGICVMLYPKEAGQRVHDFISATGAAECTEVE